MMRCLLLYNMSYSSGKGWYFCQCGYRPHANGFTTIEEQYALIVKHMEAEKSR